MLRPLFVVAMVEGVTETTKIEQFGDTDVLAVVI